MKKMPAISMWQPWAGLVADRHKKIETRSHNGFRSLEGQRVAIHATAFPGWPVFERRLALAMALVECCGTEAQVLACRVDLFGAIQSHGKFLATAFVADHRLMTPGDEANALCTCNRGRYAIVFSDIIRLEAPIPAKGHQGVWYWDVPEDLWGKV